MPHQALRPEREETKTQPI